MRNFWVLRKRLAASTALVAIVIASPAAAQDAGSATQQVADGDVGLQDIIVTARRTNERLQTTPVAVTALTTQALEQRQISAVTDIARATPSVSIGTGGTGPSTIVYIAIRGQAQNSPNSFTDAAVGIYIDGVYVARPVVGNLGFLDMAGAEVLRGPQGTLFGRNTTGGALNLTTSSPEDKFAGYVKAGVGNFDQRVVEGVLNIPLSNEVAARFAGRYDEHSAYYPNALETSPGSVTGSYYGRGTLKWEPDALPLTWTIGGDYTRYRDTGNGIALVAVNPNGLLNSFYNISQGVKAGTLAPNTPIPVGGGVSLPASTFANFSLAGSGPLTQYINPEFVGSTAVGGSTTVYSLDRAGRSDIDNHFNANDSWSATSNLAIELGNVSLKSITGFRKSTTSNSISLSGTPTGVGASSIIYKQHQFSQELQLSGNVDKLEYIAGLYYFREEGTEQSDSAILYNTPLGAYRRNLSDLTSQSVGVFGQVNYHITDDLRITGGLRYTWDKRTVNRHSVNDWRVAPAQQVCATGPNIGLTAAQAPCDDPRAAKFKYPAWTAGIDYRVSPDVFVYAKTSGASMSGGFNGRAVPPPYSDSFAPETVRDVEAGFKADLLDRKLRTNLAVFHAWQGGVQRIINQTFVSNGRTLLTQFVTNNGKARTYGVEFEATVVPWKGMTIDGSAAYLHANYVKGTRSETQLVGGAPVLVDRSGEPITQAPKWTAGIGATQVVELEAGKLSIHGDYAYVSSRYYDYFTSGDPSPAVQAAVAIANDASRVDGYSLVNGRLSFAFNEPQIEISLWGKNILNKTYFTNVFNSYTGLGFVAQGIGAPRTYGVTAAMRF